MSGRDISRRDVLALAQAMRLDLPKGCTIAAAWTLCMKRAHVLAEAYRNPELPLGFLDKPTGIIDKWAEEENAKRRRYWCPLRPDTAAQLDGTAVCEIDAREDWCRWCKRPMQRESAPPINDGGRPRSSQTGDAS